MINMYPLSFKEFLIAVGRENLINEIQTHFDNNEKMDKTIHELCLKLYRTYLVVGGMPEVVQTYLIEEKYKQAYECIIEGIKISPNYYPNKKLLTMIKNAGYKE